MQVKIGARGRARPLCRPAERVRQDDVGPAHVLARRGHVHDHAADGAHFTSFCISSRHVTPLHSRYLPRITSYHLHVISLHFSSLRFIQVAFGGELVVGEYADIYSVCTVQALMGP